MSAAQAETWLKTQKLTDISADDMLHTKQRGFSDVQIARFTCELLLEYLTAVCDSSGARTCCKSGKNIYSMPPDCPLPARGCICQAA